MIQAIEQRAGRRLSPAQVAGPWANESFFVTMTLACS